MNKLHFFPTIIALTFLLAFTTVTIIPKVVFYGVFFLTIFSFFLFSKDCFIVDKSLFLYLFFFLSISIIGLISYPISMILTGNSFDYSQLNIAGRVTNLLLLSLFVLLIYTYTKEDNITLPFKWYWLGTGILMFTAIWQFFDVFLHLVNFPFETRAQLHSTYGQEYAFNKRLTGIASEPSYFVMFAVDFIILSLLLTKGIKRKFIVILGFFLMILSLSPSGYITFFGSLGFAWIFVSLKHASFKLKPSTILFVFLSLCLIPIGTHILVNSSFFDYFFNRISDPRMLDSPRAYMSYMPFNWAWNSNPFSFLFGHGIKSYSIIGTAFNNPDGLPVHVTSNNIYVDTFWESGIIGLLILLGFFYFIFTKLMKSKHSKFQVFIGLFVLFDLMFSGIFRADFASIRFFSLLYLLFILIKHDFYAPELKSKKGSI